MEARKQAGQMQAAVGPVEEGVPAIVTMVEAAAEATLEVPSSIVVGSV